MLYRFEGFELDDEIFALRRGGVDVPLRPQALDVLLHLIRHRDRVVTKREILDTLWHGVAISDNILSQAVFAVRRALEDDTADPRIIQTVRARGYRFVAQVEPGGVTPPPQSRVFVGREGALRRLEELIQRAAAGRGGISLVVGDAGAGKTHTMAELGRRARSMGALVLEAQCRADAGVPDLWTWVQVLRACAAAGEGPLAEEASRLSAELSAPSSTTSGSEDARARFVSFDGVVQLLRRAAQQTTLVITVDDLERAGAPSLLLLNLVATSIADARIALVASYRDAALASEPVLARTVGAMIRTDPARRVALDKLSRTEVAELAEHVLGKVPDDAFLTRLVDKTDGNPMLLTQMLHALQNETNPPGDGSTSALLAVTEMREAIGVHLEVLSPETREVLRVASVLGVELTLGRLAAVRRATPQSLLPQLDEALAHRVLAKTSHGSYRFVHVLVRDVLYRSLGAAERAALHEAAGASAMQEGEAEDSVCHFERALRELDLRAESGRESHDDAAARATALHAVLRAAHRG